MHVGEISGWTSVALGQLVSWPQVLKLRHERGDGVSLVSYAIVLVSMSLYLVHAVTIGDSITMVSVPLSLCPNILIAVTLMRRRRTGRGSRGGRDSSLREVVGRGVGGPVDRVHELEARSCPPACDERVHATPSDHDVELPRPA